VGVRSGVLSAGFSFEDSPLRAFLARSSPISGTQAHIIDAAGVSAVYAGDGATADLEGIDFEQASDGPVVADGRVTF